MTNDDKGSTDETDPAGDFYFPATFQFSREPGRIERVLVGLFDEGGELEARTVDRDTVPDFYVPAMFQSSTEPGRLERVLKGLFAEDEDRGARKIPEELRDDFYLPASNPDGRKRTMEQPPEDLVPASERTSEEE